MHKTKEAVASVGKCVVHHIGAEVDLAPGVGDIKLSARDLETESGGRWLACDGREVRRAEYPELAEKLGYRYGPVKGEILAKAAVCTTEEFNGACGAYKIDSHRFGLVLLKSGGSGSLFLLSFSADYKSHTLTLLADNRIFIGTSETYRFFVDGDLAIFISCGRNKNVSNGYSRIATWRVTANPAELQFKTGSTNVSVTGNGGAPYCPVYDATTRTVYAVEEIGANGLYLVSFHVDTGAMTCTSIGSNSGKNVHPTSAGVYITDSSGWLKSLRRYDGTEVGISENVVAKSVLDYQGKLYLMGSAPSDAEEPCQSVVVDRKRPTDFVRGQYLAMPYNWNGFLCNVEGDRNNSAAYNSVVPCKDGEPFACSFVSIDEIGKQNRLYYICQIRESGVETIGILNYKPVFGVACEFRSYVEDGNLVIELNDFSKTVLLPDHIANDYLVKPAGYSGKNNVMRPLCQTAYIRAR